MKHTAFSTVFIQEVFQAFLLPMKPGSTAERPLGKVIEHCKLQYGSPQVGGWLFCKLVLCRSTPGGTGRRDMCAATHCLSTGESLEQTCSEGPGWKCYLWHKTTTAAGLAACLGAGFGAARNDILFYFDSCCPPAFHAPCGCRTSPKIFRHQHGMRASDPWV